MLGRERVLDILDKALSCSDADQAQAAVGIGQSSLTRFANNIIHQNVSERNAHLTVKAVIGKQLGYATTNRLDDGSIKAVVARAVAFARNSPENPDFVSLPEPRPIPGADTYDKRTADYSPEDRAQAVKGIIAEANKVDAIAAGQLSNGYEEYASANTLGIRAYYPSTAANMNTVMTSDSGYGYADRVAPRITDFDPIEAATEAATRSARSRNPESIEPGEYDVVLLPYAVAEFLEFMSWLGFNALAVQEGRSFMSGKLGQKVTGEDITIWDDGLNPLGIPRPFDTEGVPKERVDLIADGVAVSPVYDSHTAKKEGKRSTGHAVSLSGTYGPMATNMFLKPGEASLEEMIAGVEKGILVTRFHYTNVIHPILLTITGMTRDGTFLIENGKVTKPLKNMRFTDNVLERLSNVDMIGRDTMRQGLCVVPALKARNFRFTGGTEF